MSSAPTPETDAPPLTVGARTPESDYLDLMADLTRDYATTDDLASVHLKALGRIRDAMRVAGSSLFLLENNDSELVCHACIGPVDITGLRLPAGSGIVGRSVEKNEVQWVADVDKDPDFFSDADASSGFITRAVLAAPMSIHGRTLGAVSVVNPLAPDGEQVRQFSQRDIELMRSLASAAAMAMNNADMTRELLSRERVRQELVLAAKVQRSLLPDCSRLPANVCGISHPAREMSGDFYDVVPLPDGRLYFAVADVSGKGLNAALLMVKTTSLFRMLAKSVPEPGRLLAMLNHELCETITAGMFVTMTVGVYEPDTGRVCLSSAGHMPTLLRHAHGRFRQLSSAMPPLGILCETEDNRYPEDELLLCSGQLYLYTDGVTEGRLADGSELELEGFCRLLDELADENLHDRLESIVNRLADDSRPLRDDVTLLGLETPESRQPGLPLSFRVTAIPDRLALVRDLIHHAFAALDYPAELKDNIVLAVDEACQNIIRHAYEGQPEGEIEGSLDLSGRTLTIRLRDQAPTVPPTACNPRQSSELKPGGLGNQFINSIMDKVYFETINDSQQRHSGNCLVMLKEL